MNTLLILGRQADVQVDGICKYMPDVPIVFFNNETIQYFTFTRDISNNEVRVTYFGQDFYPKAIFWRNVFYVDFGCPKDNTNNWEAYYDLFTQAFPLATWINGPAQFKEHQTKLPQLRKVAQLVTIPDTLITNSLPEAACFLSKHKSLAIKPVCGGDYTVRVNTYEVLEDLFNTHKQPLCLQEFIDGDNVRVYVIGEKTFMSVMPSTESDFRTHNCIPEPQEIEPEFSSINIVIKDLLGLEWTAIDWIKRDGVYYYLEANFSPMFANYETACGQPISRTLAEYIKHQLDL